MPCRRPAPDSQPDVYLDQPVAEESLEFRRGRGILADVRVLASSALAHAL